MVWRISSLLLCLLILCGCKSGGMKWAGVRLTEDYVPELRRASLTSVESDFPSENIASEESCNTPEPNIVQQVSATDSGSDVPLTSFSDTASVGIALGESISLALSQNPELVTLRQTERVSSATLGVAQTYPFNPSVQVQVTPWQNARNGGAGTTSHYVLLMQTIQLAHQQQFREQGAAFTLNSTRWNIHQAELQTLAQTERLYFVALYQRGLMELAEASNRNNQQLLSTLETQLDAGQATPERRWNASELPSIISDSRPGNRPDAVRSLTQKQRWLVMRPH